MRNRPSAHVCTVCRNRKVKCDGRPGGCENCARLSYKCSFAYPEGEDDAAVGPDGIPDVPRRRARLACQPCKAQKARCSGQLPNCQRCLHKNIPCVYLPSKRTSKAARLPASPVELGSAISVTFPASFSRPPEPARPSPAATQTELTPATSSDGRAAVYESMAADRGTVKKCIDAFFNVLYPSPEYSFIHKAVFLQMWQAGDIDAVLLKAVCGVAARFVPGQTQAGKDQGAAWIDQAQAELLNSFEEPAVVRLQALQLVVLHWAAMRHFRRLLLLFSLCTRMAFLLRLNYEDPNLPFLAQESRRRLMWSIFVTDTFMAGGIPDFVLVPARKIHVCLPAEEPSFQLDRAVDTEPLRPDPNQPPSTTIGLLAYFIKVMDIRDRILRFTKELSSIEFEASSIADQFKAFEYELERLRISLPTNMAFSAKNLSLRAYSKNSLPRFVLLHVWWHQSHCDLFRFTIPGFRESVSQATMHRIPENLSIYCRTQCIGHAYSLADIFSLLVNLDQDVPITDTSLAVPAYQCANILSRSLHMGGMKSAYETKAGIQACLDLTKQLAQWNRMAAVIQEDIQRLFDYGAPSSSLSGHRTPDNAPGTGSPVPSVSGIDISKQKYSRHNAVDAADVRDDGTDLGLRSAPATVAHSPDSSQRPSPKIWQTSHSQQQGLEQQDRQPQPEGMQQDSQQQQPRQQRFQKFHSRRAQFSGTSHLASAAVSRAPQSQHSLALAIPTAAPSTFQQAPDTLEQPPQQQRQQAQVPIPAPQPTPYPHPPQPQPSSANAIMNLNDANDWTWDIPLPGNDERGMDFLFDPLWRIHSQWDVGS